MRIDRHSDKEHQVRKYRVRRAEKLRWKEEKEEGREGTTPAIRGQGKEKHRLLIRNTNRSFPHPEVRWRYVGTN